MFNQIFIIILIIIAAGIGLFFLFKKFLSGYFDSFSEKLIDKNLKLVDEKSREIFKDERERLLGHFDDKQNIIDEKIKTNEQYLQNKQDIIKELIEKIDQRINESQRKLEHTEKERISEFSNLKAILEEHKTITKNLKTSTEDLKNVLSNNQLRGRYGEEVAENLLKVAGFVKGLNYDGNLSQETNANRPDFTIYLPNKNKINIDVKFPYQSLVKFQEIEDKLEKKKYFAQFKTDVKQKIKQVTSRDYINPEEKTLDFVILFVPNEMIFSIICEKMHDVIDEANQKKVAIVGPISFVTFLRMIYQSYENFKIQEDLQRVVGLIGKFKQEFSKYNVEFDKLGNKITSASTQYNVLTTTRMRKLEKIVEQIEGEEKLEEEENKKLI